MKGTIRSAVVSERGGKFVVEDVQLDELRDEEILVTISASGICHTDLACRDQYVPVALPHVLGHEGSGIVKAVGSQVTDYEVGDHVVLTFTHCGHCSNCSSGRPAYCINFEALNYSGSRPGGSYTHRSEKHATLSGCFFGQSSFATHSISNQSNTIKVRKDVPIELLAPLGCGIQAGAGAVLNSLKAESGTSIAVFGTGTLGLSAIMAAKLAGCREIVAIDINAEKLRKATSLGATSSIDGTQNGLAKTIREITNGGADYSLDCVGTPAVFRQSVDCLHATGTAGLLGLPKVGTEVALDMQGILFGKTLKGILSGDSTPKSFIPELIDHYIAGSFPFDELINFYDFENVNSAVADLENGAVIKAVLKM